MIFDDTIDISLFLIENILYHVPVDFYSFTLSYDMNSMSQLTIEGPVEEVSVHSTGGYTQVVGGFQSVVAVVVMCWVFECKAALYVVLVNIHIRTHILSV